MDSKALFEILVRDHSPMLQLYLRAVGCPSELLDDVWQESLIVAWRRLDQYDSSRPFGVWLRGIAAKVLLASRRKHRRMTLIGDESILEYLSQRLHRFHTLPGDTLDAKLDALRDCISKLPEHERQSIELRYQKALLPSAISKQSGQDLETIKKRLVRAKQRLRECIERKMQATTW